MKPEKQLQNIRANVQRTQDDIEMWFVDYILALQFILERNLWVGFMEYCAKDAQEKLDKD